MLLSNKDLEGMNNSLTYLFTDARKSDSKIEPISENNVVIRMLNVEEHKSPIKVRYNSEMDDFLKFNGINNIKI